MVANTKTPRNKSILLIDSSFLNRSCSYSEKNQSRTVFCYILSNFRIYTILIEAITQLDRKNAYLNV